MDTITKRRGKEKLGQVNFDGKDCLVAVDMHKDTYAVAILDEDGQRLEFSTVADPKKLLLQLVKMGMRIKALVHESGPTGYGLAWACQESGVPVVVAAPSRIPRPISKTGKTDRLDSMKLVEFLARDMLRGIAVPTREEFALREMERRRQRRCLRPPPERRKSSGLRSVRLFSHEYPALGTAPGFLTKPV